MPNLDGILPLSHIVLDLETSSKKRLFEQAAELLARDGVLPQAEVFDCLFARERLGSTAIGHGVAIPHGRLADIPQVAGAFLRLREPVDFDAPDNKPVSLVFVLAVPENECGQHLGVLSHLAERFADKTVREALIAAPDAQTARALLIQ